MGRALRLLELILRYGPKIGKRIWDLEELVIKAGSTVRVVNKLSERERDVERLARLAERVRREEAQIAEWNRRADRLRQGLPETNPGMPTID